MLGLPSFSASISAVIMSAFEAVPVVPGKIFPGALLLLSVVALSVIFFKSVFLILIRRADQRFLSRLKRSQTCFEVLEEGKNYRPSAFFEIYQIGARSALHLLLDQQNRPMVPQADWRCFATGLTPGNVIAIDGGFVIGERSALRRFGTGFTALRNMALLAPLIGMAGAAWVVVLALNTDGILFYLFLIYALILIIASLIVTVPIAIFRVILRCQYREKAKGIARFRAEITRIFRQEMEIDPKPIEDPTIQFR